MKKIKIIIIFLISIFTLTLIKPIKVNADIGPKTSVTITISGIEGKYAITLIAKESTGPYSLGVPDGEEIEDDIQKYIDEEGYQYAGAFKICEDEDTFTWGYYPPMNFKILIRDENNTYYSSDALERYAFSTYYKVSINQVQSNEIQKINDVEKNYNYFIEIIYLLIRIIITVGIEIGIAFLFMIKEKRNIKIITLVNLTTQALLNVSLALVSYFDGWLASMIILFFAEIIVFLFEIIAYLFLIKDEKKWKIVIYGFVANFITYLITYLFYIIGMI